MSPSLARKIPAIAAFLVLAFLGGFFIFVHTQYQRANLWCTEHVPCPQGTTHRLHAQTNQCLCVQRAVSAPIYMP